MSQISQLSYIDIAIVVVYLAVSVGVGCWFVFRSRSPEGFTAASGKLGGILVGFSIFGTYVSSISYIAYPGKSFVSDWNGFVFSLSVPFAAWVAVRWFVPYYRNIGAISAYHNLETRFGAWARVYATFCYMLTQVARMGAVMFLLALPLRELLGWDIPTVVIVLGLLTTFYSMIGGIEGVIWTDAIQSIVLIAGAVICVILIPLSMPEGPKQLFNLAIENNKFSLGSYSLTTLAKPTFLVVFIYGIVINLQNFGIDQNYVQRYLTAKSDYEAKKSVWFGALLFLPVSAFFFFIGTALFSFYHAQPDLLPREVWDQIDAGKGDIIFPYYIVHQLPSGLTGLLIAAIMAAAMSTISASINGSATLTLTDFYKRFWRPNASSREQMLVLYGSSLFWGLLGMGCALAMMKVSGVLDAWWALSGFFSGGMLGVFLLGFLSRRPKNAAAIGGVIVGLMIIVWMTLSHPFFKTETFSILPESLESRFCDLLATVFGTAAILIVGFGITYLFALIGKSDKSKHQIKESK